MSDAPVPSDATIPGRLELSAPADPEMMDLVHAMLEQLWTNHAGVPDADRFRFEMAVMEILGNIVEHSYRMEHPETGSDTGVARRFDISLGVTDRELVASFEDNGMPVALDLSNVTMPEEDAESGRGLALAQAAVDDMSYERVGGRNHWRLLCIRSPG